jgi:hypothetical protein
MECPISTIGRKISHMCGVKIVKFERRIEDYRIALHLYRLRDLPVLRSGNFLVLS